VNPRLSLKELRRDKRGQAGSVLGLGTFYIGWQADATAPILPSRSVGGKISSQVSAVQGIFGLGGGDDSGGPSLISIRPSQPGALAEHQGTERLRQVRSRAV